MITKHITSKYSVENSFQTLSPRLNHELIMEKTVLNHMLKMRRTVSGCIKILFLQQPHFRELLLFFYVKVQANMAGYL